MVHGDVHVEGRLIAESLVHDEVARLVAILMEAEDGNALLRELLRDQFIERPPQFLPLAGQRGGLGN
jgi:hypothetical protein